MLAQHNTVFLDNVVFIFSRSMFILIYRKGEGFTFIYKIVEQQPQKLTHPDLQYKNNKTCLLIYFNCNSFNSPQVYQVSIFL